MARERGLPDGATRAAEDLARLVSPDDVALVPYILAEYAAGGRRRAALTGRHGEDTGGFGIDPGGVDFVVLLDALAGAGGRVMAVLDHQAVGNIASLAALAVAIRQGNLFARGRNPSRGGDGPEGTPPPAQPEAVPGTPEVTAEASAVAAEAATAIREGLTRAGMDQQEADRLAEATLISLASHPGSSIDLLGSLDPTLHPPGT